MINAQDWSRAEINEWLANLPIKPDYAASGSAVKEDL
jgi:hypothetical protein